MRAAQSATAAGVTLLTADSALAAEIARLGAAADVSVAVHGDAPAPGRWPPGLVLVGADLAGVVTRTQTWRPGDVVIVGQDDTDGLAGEGGGGIWRQAVSLGAARVAILPDAREWLVALLAATVEPRASARVVGVLGGCGGAGASVFAAALAVAAAERAMRTLLVDLDPLGGGIDLLLGLDEVPGLRWPGLASAQGRLPASAVHDALPRAGSLAVLSWARGEPIDLLAPALGSTFDAAVRGHDLVVVDLPRGMDSLTDLALNRVGELLIMVPGQLRAVVAAGQTIAAVGARIANVRAVVRRGAGSTWPAGRVAQALAVPLAAQLKDDHRLAAEVAGGESSGRRLQRALSRGGLAKAARHCLELPPIADAA